MRAFVILCAVVACVSGQSQSNECNAKRRSTGINLANANAVIGGIFDFRKAVYGSYACGTSEDNMQLYEAARFAIKKMNDANYVPGVKFGMKVYDTCSSPDIAKSAALDFFPQSSNTDSSCQNAGDVLKLGLLGTLKDSTTLPVALMTSTFPVSMMSPKATASYLSHKSSYPYFLRTSYPMIQWARAAINVGQQLGWKRIVIVHTSDDYGKAGLDALITHSYFDGQTCVGEAYAVGAGGGVNDYSSRLNEVAWSNTVGAVFVGSSQDAKTLLKSIGNSDANSFVRRVQWIFSDINRQDADYNTHQFAKGMLHVGLEQTDVSEFKDYFVNIDVNAVDNENPWLQEWYAQTEKCGLLPDHPQTGIWGTRCTETSVTARRNKFVQQHYVPQVIKAVYAYGKALKTAQAQRCTSRNGICASLLSMAPAEFHNKYLTKVDLRFGTDESIPSMGDTTQKFDSNGDPENVKFLVYNYNGRTGSFQFEEVGDDSNGKLTLQKSKIVAYDAARTNALGAYPSSPCPNAGCSNCILPEAQWQHVTYYKDGDLFIGGIVGQRNPGATALTCGGIWEMGMEISLALRYGLNNVKKEFPDILNGVELGYFLVDDCNSGDLAQMYLADMLSRRTGQRNMFSNYKLDPESFPMFIETTIDGGMTIAGYLTSMMKPLLSSTATSSDLMGDMYKYFSRVVPGEDRQVAAIAKLMNRMGWTYAQTIITDSSPYATLAIRDFHAAADKELVCIAQKHTIPDSPKGSDYDKLIDNMRASPDAKAVVIFGWDEKIAEVFKALERKGAVGEFLIIAGESWATSDFQKGLENAMRGSITMRLDDVQSYVTKVENYFKNELRPSNMRGDMWFEEYYQQHFNCYINPYYRNKYVTPCTNQAVGEKPNWGLTSYATYATLAAYVAAHALNQTLTDFCGENYNGVCASFRHSSSVSEALLANIKKASIPDFKMKNGEGDVIWNVMNYNRANTEYREVATYGLPEGHLSDLLHDLEYPGTNVFTSKCSQWCPACSYVFTNQPVYHIPGDVELGALFYIHHSGPVGPFSCGDIALTDGYQYAAAVAYALESINGDTDANRPFKLNGVKLGAFMIDYCDSSARAQALTTALYTGAYRPGNMMTPYPVSKLGGWMTVQSGITVQMNDFVKELKLPVISPAATKPDLNANSMYPTFFRTVQGDDFNSLGMLKLCKSMGFKYVQVIYETGEWGESAFKTFKALGQQEGVCVTGSHEMSTNSEANQILTDIKSSSSHVVIVFVDTEMTAALLEQKIIIDSATGSDKDILFVLSMPFPLQMSAHKGDTTTLVNTLSLTIDAPKVEGFMNYLRSLSPDDVDKDPFFRDYYQAFYKCDLAGEKKYNRDCSASRGSIPDSNGFFQDLYAVSTIDAVYAFAGAVDAVLIELCGEDYDGLCDAFKNNGDIPSAILRKMGSVSFVGAGERKVEFTNGEAAVTLNILRWTGQKYIKIGNFAGASLIWDETISLTGYTGYKSECENQCLKCLDQRSIEYTYIPGDILLGGLFDVHERAIDPFSCGIINTRHGYQYLEAFQFALHQVNNKDGIFKDILPNVRIGGVGLDNCESAARTGYTVSNINSGQTVLNRDGNTIDPDKIVAYIGTYASDRSQYVARILKTLKKAQISYKSSSIELLDRNRYPYFLATVPADDTLAKAMIKVLAYYDISYVQIAHSDDSYGINGATEFKKLAKKNRICVAQSIAFQGNGTITRESAKIMVRQLVKKPNAHMVVVFAPTLHAELLLESVAQNPEANGKIKFIGTDTWANQIHIIEGNKDVASGSITVNVEYDDIVAFDEYLRSKSIASYTENPWFADFYEEMHNCYLGDRNPRYPNQCSATSLSVTLSSRYKQDPGLVNVMNAVYSTAFGLHRSLKEVCGEGYTTVCESFLNMKDKAELIVRNTQDVSFKDASNKVFSFTDRGDGKKGYYFYQVAPTAVKEFQYSQIGAITTEDTLVNMLEQLPVQLNAGCDRVDVCMECPSIRNMVTRYMSNAPINAEDKAIIVGIFNVHKQGRDEFVCGSLSSDGGFVEAMAMFYAIHKIKENNSPPFDIRGLAIDTCSNDIRVDQDIFNLLSGNGLCNSMFDRKGISANNIPAFLSQFTTNTYAASRVLSPLKVSLLSHSATSDVLSDQRRHNYFARTVPPDAKQMELIAQILRENSWTYFSLVFDRSQYASSASEMLKSYLSDRRLCSAYSVQVPIGISPGGADALIRQLDEYEDSKVVVLIGYDSTIMEILAAAKRLGKLDRFLWIGTDTWGSNENIIKFVKGSNMKSISLNVRSTAVEGFERYLGEKLQFVESGSSRQLPDDIPREWFEEFFQKTFKCRLESAKNKLDFDKACNKTWTLDNHDDIDRSLLTDNYVIHALSAVEAIVEGLRSFKNAHCLNAGTLRQCFDDGVFDVMGAREALFQSILNVAIDIDAQADYRINDNFYLNFTSGRFWDVGYDIYYFNGDVYKKIPRKDVQNFRLYTNSSCTEEVRCPQCQRYDRSDAMGQGGEQEYDKMYKTPRNYYHYKKSYVADQDRYKYEKSYEWPVWVIVVAILTCIGIVVTLLVALFLVISYPNFGGSTALGYMIILGILGIYGVNFAFFLPAAMATCAARRLVMGIVYAIVFACLLVKAIDNWRFSDVDYTVRKYKGVTSACALFFSAIGLVLVEAIIPIMWLILVHPTATHLGLGTMHDYWWCDPFDEYDEGLVLSFLFVMFLIVLTAIFSGISWESENNYYESRWIFISAIATAGCFLVWMVVTTNAGPPFRDPAVAIANLVNATALLMCLPIRKMVLLISIKIEQKKFKEPPQDIQDNGEHVYTGAYSNSAYDDADVSNRL